MSTARRSILPVAPCNWHELKRAIPGLDEAAKTEQKIPLYLIEVKELETGVLSRGDVTNYLNRKSLRLLTIQEAFFALTKHPDLLKKLKGKTFYVGGLGPEEDGEYTIQPDGSLKPGRSPDREKNVLHCSGSNPLWIGVCIYKKDFRFATGAIQPSMEQRIVSVPEDVPINSICEEMRRQI